MVRLSFQFQGFLLAWCCKNGQRLNQIIQSHIADMSSEVKKKLGGEPQSRLLTTLSANILTSFQV